MNFGFCILNVFIIYLLSFVVFIDSENIASSKKNFDAKKMVSNWPKKHFFPIPLVRQATDYTW